MSDEASGCLLLIAVMVTGISWANWHYDLNPLSDEITIYTQNKECDKVNNKKCKWISSYYTTYKVNSDMQTVISWDTSDNNSSLTKHRSCIVIDNKHWICGSNYKYGVTDGEYTSKDGEWRRYVSKTKWWYEKYMH